MMQVAGFILTGGQSARMGVDKALLRVGNTTLCERIADVMSPLVEKVFLVGQPERYRHLQYDCLPDIRPGLGPISGLESILSAGVAEFNLVSSCDSYNLDSVWLSTLISEATTTGSFCTVAKDASGRLQPLCAVYRRQCLQTVSQAINGGKLRATELVEKLNAHVVNIPGTMLNLNSPEDYNEILNTDGRI